VVIVKNNHPVLAVDLGGTKIRAAIVSPDYRVIARSHCLTHAEKGPDKVISRLSELISGTLAQARLTTNEIRGICIAAAGAIDSKRGLITSSPNLPRWRNMPLRDEVASRFGVTTWLLNDASAAALGEQRLGAGNCADNLIYITVSTGIGGGIIIGGDLYIGDDGCAGEIGHMIIKEGGPVCNCGQNGCLESLASGTAIAREALSRIDKGQKTAIYNIAGGDLKNVTAEIVALAAKQGDTVAREIIREASYYLGIGLANIVNIFNPELIVIGGGLSNMGNMFLGPARETMKRMAFKLPARNVRIVRSRLKDNAGILGAAIYILNRINANV
jgi:glucokinase